ncbi:11938_t:CDS:2, partial [Funneliformis geosporum]
YHSQNETQRLKTAKLTLPEISKNIQKENKIDDVIKNDTETEAR